MSDFIVLCPHTEAVLTLRCAMKKPIDRHIKKEGQLSLFTNPDNPLNNESYSNALDYEMGAVSEPSGIEYQITLGTEYYLENWYLNPEAVTFPYVFLSNIGYCLSSKPCNKTNNPYINVRMQVTNEATYSLFNIHLL